MYTDSGTKFNKQHVVSMIDIRFFDEMAQRLGNLVPAGVGETKKEVEAHIKTLLQKAFSELDLVTRDEFDIQSAVLRKTREKLEVLEKKITEIEQAAASD